MNEKRSQRSIFFVFYFEIVFHNMRRVSYGCPNGLGTDRFIFFMLRQPECNLHFLMYLVWCNACTENEIIGS